MICKKCGKEFEPQKGLKNYCSLKCRNSRTWSEEDKEKKSITNKGRDEFKTALGKKGDLSPSWKGGKIIVICQYCNEPIETYDKNKKYHGECWKKIAGGYRQGSGRGKKYWYESKIAGRVFLDSSYELAYAKYLDEQNINWKRNTKRFYYIDNNKKRYYIPDFYLIDKNIYIEIKGYSTTKDELKWKNFPYELKVLFGKDLKQLGINVI